MRYRVDIYTDKKTMAERIVSHDNDANDECLCANDEAPDNNHPEKQSEVDAADESDAADATDDDGNEEQSNDEGAETASNRSDDDEKNNDNDNEERGASTPRLRKQLPRKPYSFRDVEESIESFGAEDGQDVKLWMKQFESISNIARWNDEEKLIMCRKKLTNTARRFVFAQRNFSSFVSLKNALMAEFSPVIRASDVHRKLAARKKNSIESIHDYIYEMQRIALPIQLDEPSICEYVIDGITDDEFYRAILYEAQTIKHLKEKLLNYEKVQRKSYKKSRSDDGHLKRKEQRKLEQKKESECPQKSNGPKCFNCNTYGHLSKECQKKNDKKSNKKQTATVNVLKTVNNLKPYVNVQIHDLDIRAFVDTGSELSLVRLDLWLKFEKSGEKLQKSGQKVRGYGGDVSVVCGEAILRMLIENDEYEIRVYVVPNSAIDMPMIIGMDYLQRVDYAITPSGVRITKLSVEDSVTDACDEKWIGLIEEYMNANEITVPYQYRDQIMQLIENYKPATKVKATNELQIRLTNNDIVCENPRRLAPLEKDVVKKQVDEWLRDGIIQPSDSEYASAIVVVPKKDGSRRVCVDYREINKRMLRDKFPMPNLEEQIDKLSNARIFTTLDLKSSYFHVPIERNSQKYTSFVTSEGQYEFLRAPFGLCTSRNAFGRFINTVLKDLIKDGKVIVFVDDIIIPSKDEDEGLKILNEVLEVAEAAGLQFNWGKCVFLQRRVEYLGYTVYDGRIEPAPDKVEKLKQFPQPRTTKQLQRFYGLVCYEKGVVLNSMKKL
ncbi:uncharacterized protein LOC131428832 [Malaya genurostris]|uniref:uncharacterized protein LOC131428832 n=1 Tax=Malaya genurostris TaxID=325434 RepID=UPI0026F38A61|nr:uncharacterized protein LOC131428832 [Malaya genurostris]